MIVNIRICVFCSWVQIHDKLKQYEQQSPTPVLHSASCLAEDVGAMYKIQVWVNMY